MRNKGTVLGKMFWQAFLTSTVIELSAIGSGLIDGIVISKMLGSTCMAAEGIAHPFFSIAGIVSGLLAVGMQTLCSSALARGRVKDLQNTFSMVTIVATIISACMSLMLFFRSNQVVWLLGARGNAAGLQDEAAAYMQGLSLGVIPMILCVIFSSALTLERGSRLVQIAAIAGSLTDIVGDIIAAVLDKGMQGMGLATSISYVVNLLILLLHFTKKDRLVRLAFRGLPWKKLKDVAVLGSEKATRRLVNTIRPIALNAIIIAAGGELGMAALSIRNNVGNFLEIPIAGISGAVAVLAGICYGEKNKDDMAAIGRIAHRYSVIYNVVLCILIVFLANPMTDFYVAEEETQLANLVRFSFYTLAVGNFFTTLLICRTSYLQSVRHIRETQALTIASKLVVVVVCSAICVNIWGSYGVIAALSLSDIVVDAGIYVYHGIRRRKACPTVDDYLDLPEEFNLKPQDVIELNIDNLEDAALVSQQVQLFCKGHGLAANKSYKAALCMEELTINILQHGYKKNRNNQPVGLRVVINQGDVILRIRDGCDRFDLKECIDTLRENDDMHNIGTRLVARTAKEVKYVSILNTNTAIITI